MKKLIPIILVFACCLSCLFACVSEDETPTNDNNNDNSSPSYGDAAVFAPGDYVQIVYGNDDDRVGASILREYVDELLGESGRAVVTTSYAMNVDHEIVVGLLDESRPATVKAYQLLERYERESYFTPRYVIYAEKNTVAIAYDHVSASPIQPIEYIVNEFIENYVEGKEYLAFGKGTITAGDIDLIPIQEEIDAENLSKQWAEFEYTMGKDVADAVRTLYTLYTDDIVDWFANLYDPGIGAFYAASSGRDGKEFGPDVENGVQILSFIQSSGMLDDILDGEKLEWSKLLPAEMRAQMIYFAKSLQSTNGYFYHPQWSKNTIDSNIIRRSRDLGRSTNILTSLGSAPTYNAPNGTKGDGITAEEFWELEGVGAKPYTYDKSPVYGESTTTTNNLGESAAVAVSKIVLAADDSSNTAYLKSHKAFIDYVLDVVIPGVKNNPYSGGSEIGESQSQVNVADKELGPYAYQPEDGARYAEYDGMTLREILVHEMNKIINPETGFWGDVRAGHVGTEFLYTNGFMKSMAMYNGLKMPYPEEYAAIAARGLMNALLSDEPSENNICEVYNVWVSICRLNENLQYIDNVEVRKEVKQIVSDALAESAAEAIINSYNKIKGYKKYDGGFAHSYTKGTATHSNMPVATGKDQSDVDATCIGITGVVSQIRIALGCSSIMPDIYTASDWMRFYQILKELSPVIKYDEASTAKGPAIYTFDDEDVSGLNINTSNSIVKEGTDGKLCIHKTGTASGATLGVPANVTNPLANVTIFEADVKYANITAISETQITLGTKSTDALSYSPILILLQFSGTSDGSKILYSDYQYGSGNGQKIDTGAVIGEWFKIRVEYYGDGENVPFYYKTYINNKLIYVSTAIYSKNIVDGKTMLPTANSITRMNYTMNMRFLGDFYFDNVSLVQTYDEKAKDDPDYNFKPVDPTPDIDINLPPETEFGPLMKFDGMPASDRITVSSTNVQNAHTIVSADSGNKVLHLSKPGSPTDYSSSYNFTVKTTAKDDNPTVAVFTADILCRDITSISDIQITAKTTSAEGSSASPFIIFLTPRGTADGSVIKYNEFGPRGTNNSVNKDLEAKVGKWFRLRIEYRVTATDSNGVPTAIEYKTFINDKLVYTSSSIYGAKLVPNGGEVQLPTVESMFGITLSFNSKLCGDFYIDNVGFIKCAGEYVAPEAETEVGKDSSLEPGSGSEEPHSHNFVDGKCECGESDPNYKPTDPEVPTPDDGSNVLTFANMPAATDLKIGNSYAENSYSITALPSGNKVLLVDKKCDGTFGCSFVLTVSPIEKQSGAKRAVFTADVLLSEITATSQIQISASSTAGTGATSSPFLALLSLSGTSDGSVIKYTAKSGAIETDAKVGSWFRIRIEYSVSEVDSDGIPTAMETKVYVNDVLLETVTDVYGSNFEINGGSKKLPKVDEITGFALSFNSKLVGKCYVDNIGLNICDEFVMSDVESEIAGGEPEAPHEHNFVEGKCECGETDPNYKPFAGVVDFESDYSAYVTFSTKDELKDTNTATVVSEGENKVLFIDKAGKDVPGQAGGGATINIKPTKTEANAKIMVLEFDLKLANITGSYDTQILMYHNGLSGAKNSPFLISLPRVENEWAHVIITYEVTAFDDGGTPSAIKYCVYVSGVLQNEKTDVYGSEIKNGNVALPKASEVTAIAIGLNNSFLGDAYLDNISLGLLESFKIEQPKTDGTVTFDEMPATSILSISSPGITSEGIVGTNTWDIATVGEEKVLHIVKSATGHNEAGELLNYNCGVSITKPISGNSSNANVAIFEADIMYVSVDAIDDIQITFNSVSTSPILGLFRPVAKEAGSAIKNNGSTGTTSGETSAKVGEWFHLRIEYRVTETNADGAPTSIEVKYFIGDDVIVSTTAYKTPLRLSELTKASLSFNKLNKGEYYVDNVCFRLDYVEPVAQ